MTERSSGGLHTLAVHSVNGYPGTDGSVAAFAIDAPRAGDRLPGLGLEVNGWVIGRHEGIVGVRTVAAGAPSHLHPLDVRRPDVAADYPDHPAAGNSGFSFWAPVDTDAGSWTFQIEAVFAGGRSIPLATIQGAALLEQPRFPPGHRPVWGPDFVIIGTQRGGTTSLHAYLGAHPLVTTPVTKELHYLTDRYERGSDWYAGQFPSSLQRGALTGEATPYALFHPRSPHRLRDVAPAARIIVLLRNPVDRAYSHYRLERSRENESLSFTEALAAEQSRLAGEEQRLAADDTYVSHVHNHASYLSRGDYAPQLEGWFSAFPRERFLILRSEDLYECPEESFARVTSFLELPSLATVSFTAHNRGEGPPLDETIRGRLMQHFAPRNDRLTELLGWDPAWT